MLLEIKKLNIEFYDHNVPERVVNNFDMEMEQGDILGIVGESGSGKSMTAMAIAGLLKRHDLKKEGEIFEAVIITQFTSLVIYSRTPENRSYVSNCSF